MEPGATALIRTCEAAHSMLRVLQRLSAPARAAAVCDMPCGPNADFLTGFIRATFLDRKVNRNCDCCKR